MNFFNHFLLYALFFLLLFSACEGNEPISEPEVLKEESDSAFFISKINDDTIYTNVPFKLEGAWKDTAIYKFRGLKKGGVSIVSIESPKYQYRFDSLNIVSRPFYWDSTEIVPLGSDTFLLPEKVVYKPHVVILKSGIPVRMDALRRKENARIDLMYLNTESGLPSSYINTLLFSKDGAMWIGTQKGLCRYDGKFLVNYTMSNGLPDDFVTQLFEDSQGNIWIGTQYGGAAKYDGKFLTIFNSENGLHANSVTGIKEDSKGNIWICMWGGGIAKFDGETIESIDRQQGLLETRVLNMEVDENDYVWIATNGKGLYCYDSKSIVRINQQAGYGDRYLTSLFFDSKKRLWLGNWVSMVYLTKDSVSHIQFSSEVRVDPTSSIFEDSNGNIWFASTQFGAVRYDEKSVMMINELGGLSSNKVNDIAEDPAGNIWFATDGGGICRYNPNSFEYFDESAGLNNKLVNSINETADGRVMFATDDGISFFNDSSFFKVYGSVTGNKQGGRVYDIFKTQDNTIWYSVLNNAIYKMSGDSLYHFGQWNGVHDHNITSFEERKNGEIWMGAWNVGMARLNEIGYTVFNAKSGLHNFVINDLVTDHQDNLWIATDGEGITKYDGTFFTHITENEGLVSNHVNAFYFDSFKNLWVLSKGGINIISSDGKISKFATPSLLPDKDVVSMVQDKDGNYWVFTANGLLYLQLKKSASPSQWNLADYDSKLFTQFDGLSGMDFLPRSVFIDSKNRIWFGTGKGLMMKNLTSFDITPKIPEISLETVKLSGHFMDYNNLEDATYDTLFTDFELVRNGIGEPEKFTNLPSSLTLPSSVNHLTFMFSAKGWHSDKNLFTYKLEGVDENWSLPSKDAWAEYRNLSHGDFTFQLKGIGESNVESEILEYHFTILPPWYHTWWARVIFLILIIFGVRLIVRFRTRQLQHKQVILENKVQERTAELDVKNKELVSQNAIIEEQKVEVEKRKEEIEKQHTLLEETHKEIKDSINYAKRIQEAILPTNETVTECLPNNFILYKPKDVVAGDFYWIQKTDSGVLFSAADCTGHGVPGAMVSVVCYNALNRSVREFELSSPEKILDKTREIVLETFQQNSAQVNDGMDAAIIHLSAPQKNGERILLFSGANNSVAIVRKGEMFELEGDKQPVGNYMDAKPFTLKSFTIVPGDTIYLFTDGYADQFGGPKGKKLKSKALKELLITLSKESLNVQKEKLLHYLEEWKGDLEQLDDISVFGFKL